MNQHKSVLLNEVLEHLSIGPNKTFLDVTFGAGGHTRAILEAEPTCTVYALDWDKKMLERYSAPLKEEFGDRFISIWGNFSLLYRLAKRHKMPKFDGILADFGCSQPQLHENEGFSFFIDSPLDMRMSSAHYKETAADIVNLCSEKELMNILNTGGEERFAKKIALAIAHERKIKPIKTTKQLASIVEKAIGSRAHRNKKTTLHPATKTFQAIRIRVNRELENIISFFPAAYGALKTGGKLLCISFHSLEDRLVKTYFREQSIKWDIPHAKPIGPTDHELEVNQASRSAKLRIGIKKTQL